MLLLRCVPGVGRFPMEWQGGLAGGFLGELLYVALARTSSSLGQGPPSSFKAQSSFPLWLVLDHLLAPQDKHITTMLRLHHHHS